MRIINQSFEILKMDDASHIELAARTCYKSEDKIGCTVTKTDSGYIKNGKEIHGGECLRDSGPGNHLPCQLQDCSNHSSGKFVRGLIKRGHEAMIEHGAATVKFITNRGVTHELVRHRVASYGQESTRYVNYGGDDIAFIWPVWCDSSADEMNKSLIDNKDSCGNIFRESVLTILGWVPDVEWLLACHSAEKSYCYLINECGWLPEQAREVLPNSLKTEIVVTANYREWRHIFKLRAIGTTGKPHPQMQALMLPVLHEFQRRLPALFDDLTK